MTTKQLQPKVQHPPILKVSQTELHGVQALNITRHAIGYVVKGTKHIYNGDTCREICRGDVFFLCSGTHYIEDVPADGEYEQIVFYYTSEELNRTLSTLSSAYGFSVQNDHTCELCSEHQSVSYTSWRVLREFFRAVEVCLQEGAIPADHVLERIKMVELIYLIVSNPDCCLKRKVIEYSDTAKDNFEQIIYDNIFKDVSLATIATLCNRSLTSFKKEFREHFFESPHKWFIKQRLIHARLLLISTSKPIVEISNECSFPNVSHFIKLFRNLFGMTPGDYRSKYKNSVPHKQTAAKATV